MPQPPLPFDRDPEPAPTAEQPPERDAAELGRLLGAAVGGPVEVVLGRSRRHPVQMETRRHGDEVRRRVRLHARFATAPDPVVADLAAWMRSGRRARRAVAALDAWIAASVPSVEPRRATGLQTRGEHHDLAELRDSVLADASAGPVHGLDPCPPIGWGRWPTKPPRRRIQLGSYSASSGAVRIHPVLDAKDVPRHALRFVLFHELLHAALELPPGETAHGPSFRAAERRFESADESTAWIDARSGALIERVARRVRARRRA